MKVNLDDQVSQEAPPKGVYPCEMTIDAIRRDRDGREILDGDGEPERLTTRKGEPFWKAKSRVLDGPYEGQEIDDSFFFSKKGMGRVDLLYVRAGLAPSAADAKGDPEKERRRRELDVQPDDLNNSLWWVTVEDVIQPSDQDGKPIVRRDGTPFLRSKVKFDGYVFMTPKDREKYRKIAQATSTTF
jgi:hypothetical protein